MYSTTTGRTRRDARDGRGLASQHGTRQGGRRSGRGEVEGWAAGLRKEVGGGGERGEQGTEKAGRLDNREGGLDERAATADEENRREGQGRGWATLFLSCLLLGFETCKVQ